MDLVSAWARRPIGRLPLSPLTILAGATGAISVGIVGPVPAGIISLLLGALSGALLSDR